MGRVFDEYINIFKRCVSDLNFASKAVLFFIGDAASDSTENAEVLIFEAEKDIADININIDACIKEIEAYTNEYYSILSVSSEPRMVGEQVVSVIDKLAKVTTETKNYTVQLLAKIKALNHELKLEDADLDEKISRFAYSVDVIGKAYIALTSIYRKIAKKFYVTRESPPRI